MNRRLFLKGLTVSPLYFSAYTYSMTPTDNEISIKSFGAKGNGFSDDSLAFINALTSTYTDIYIPSGIYILERPIELSFNKNLHVKCEDNVIIKLADNVRKTLFIFQGDNEHDFSWEGGDIDGNWEGQSVENKNIHGRFNDISHGLVLNNWRNCSITNIYLHDFMGHHVNHAGNLNFYARKIKIRSHISNNFPDGGARGDGITGASRNNFFEDIYGFSTDDLIGLFAGIKWLPNATNSKDTIINSVYINNVHADSISKNGSPYYTWHAVTIGVSSGFEINDIQINNVSGVCKDRGVGIITYVANHDYDYFGRIKKLSLNNISCNVIGFSGDNYLNSPVVLGEPNKNYKKNYNIEQTIKIDYASISGVFCEKSSTINTCIAIGNISSRLIYMTKIMVKSKVEKNIIPFLTIAGPTYLDDIVFDDMTGNVKNIIHIDIPNIHPVKLINKSNSLNDKSQKIELSINKTLKKNIVYSNNDFTLLK
ncbi:glycosyl hydrolase family 28-related protein [Raoultella planticola]|uniref:glycosyl hydrolase family 28-related protein n=1 Tax=Raoultella planticola TaxID=575 RepID=UPI00207436EC|nr:glycosyl hydrolase family 28-related protein [Raoultella planticola]